MAIQGLVFALITWGLTLVIAMVVAGIIKLIYFVVHRREPPAAAGESKPTAV